MTTSTAPEPAIAEPAVRATACTPWPAGRSIRSAASAAARPAPLVLAERAQRALHVHAFRDAARILVLLAVDALAIIGVRVAGRAILDQYATAALTAAADPRLPGELPATAATVEHVRWFLTTNDARAVLALLLGIAFAGAYRPGDQRRSTTLMVAGVFIGVLLNGWEDLWNVPQAIPVAIACAVILGLVLGVVRIGLDRVLDATRALWDTPRRTLVVGKAWAANELLNGRAFPRSRAFEIVGAVDAEARGERFGIGMLGSLDDLPHLIQRNEVETVIVAGSLPAETYRQVVHVADAAGCTVFQLPATAHVRGFDPELEWYGGDAMIRLSRPGMQARHLIVKRVVDVVGAAIGLTILAPLMLAIAIAVRVSSPGPILFRQQRVGRGGRLFWMYKFRSMVADAEARKAELQTQSVYASPHLFKIPSDPRVTRVGAFLRKTSLDELPQLWNVLIGDMSLVGPRPPLPSEVAAYDEHHFVRLAARPGITGPWQVSGRNAITDFEQVVELERDYLRAWSFWRDLSILIRTVPAVLLQRGAC